MKVFTLQKIHNFFIGLWALSLLFNVIAFALIGFFAWLPTVLDELPSEESLHEISGVLLNIEKRQQSIGTIPPHYVLTLKTEKGERVARLALANISADWERVLDERKPLKSGMHLRLSVNDSGTKKPWIFGIRVGQFEVISYQDMQQLSKGIRQSSGKTLILLLKIILLLGLIAIVHQTVLKWIKKKR